MNASLHAVARYAALLRQRGANELGSCATCGFWRPLYAEGDGTETCEDCFRSREGAL